jgi:hypothetical protein
MKKITIPFQVKDANIVSLSLPENDYPPYSSSTAYALGDRVILTGVNVHQVWQSVHGVTGTYPLGNLGYSPSAELDLDNPVHWSLVGATNAYKTFDTYTSTQSTASDYISFQVKDLGVVNAIGLINIDAATAQLVATDMAGAEIYNKTVDLTSYSTFTSYYDYYFTPFLRRNVYVFEDIPPVENGKFTITLTAVGNVAIGNFVGGYGYEISGINYTSSVRQKDYSIKQQLPTGEYFFQEGATSTIADFYFTIPNEKFDLLQRLIQNLRATPALYIGSEIYDSTILYGIVLDAPSTLTYATHSECRMQIESLI